MNQMDWKVLFVDDEEGIRKVMAVNLIFNALDAMPQGGVLTVSSSFRRADGMVLIEVRDTGCGISKQDLPHIFELFITTKTEGQELGPKLSTVFGIINRNKGTIHAASDVGNGTAFTVKLSVEAKLS